jgi:hypothetical protein
MGDLQNVQGKDVANVCTSHLFILRHVVYMLPMQPSESNSCLDERFWRLVFRALSANSQGSISKANYMWLNPLLLRYPLLPLMSTIMRHASSVSDNIFLECCAAVRAIATCSTIKPTFDSSLELLLETISAIAGSVQGGAEDIWLERPRAQSFTLLAIEHCRPSLLEGSNKKKVCTLRVRFKLSLLSIVRTFSGSYCLDEWADSYMGGGAGTSPASRFNGHRLLSIRDDHFRPIQPRKLKAASLRLDHARRVPTIYSRAFVLGICRHIRYASHPPILFSFTCQ